MERNAIGIAGRVRLTRLPPSICAPLSRPDLDRLIRGRFAQVAVDTPNLVTDIGLQTACALLAMGWGNPTVGAIGYTPSTVAGAAVASMQATAYPVPGIVAPAVGDTALQGTVIFSRTVSGVPPLVVTYPAAGQVLFSALIPQLDYNGTTFTEEGLFSAGGQLVARTTFAELKTNAYALQLDHLLTLSRI